MTVDFCDYFWGDKNEGFNVLYQNMKSGSLAAKELTDFFRESAKLEEENAKTHAKLAKQLSSTGNCGTFGPLLAAFKVSAEKLALIHNQWTVKLNELAKEMSKYAEELHRKHKQVKDEEAPTLAAVRCVQDTNSSLTKCKDNYKQKCQELEKLKREGASSKEIEKVEAKYRRSHEEYKTSVALFGNAREDFERKMTLATRRFQEVETSHITQLRNHVETYCQIVDHNNNQLGRVYQDFQIQLTGLTIENLLEQFTLAKHTGFEKPGAVEFEEEKISLASITGPPSDISDRSANSLGALNDHQKKGEGDGISLKSGNGSLQSSGGVPLVSIVGSASTTGVLISTTTSPSTAVSSNTEGAINSAVNLGTSLNTSGSSDVKGILGIKRGRKKDKKSKKSSGTRDEEYEGVSSKDGVNAGSDGEDTQKSATPTPEVDEEGYSRPPINASNPGVNDSDPWSDFNRYKNEFGSSSDESDDDIRKPKIKVEIKPISAIQKPVSNDGSSSVFSASVDELRSAVTALEIAPPPPTSKLRPKSVLSDRILSGAQTLKIKQREPRMSIIMAKESSDATNNSASSSSTLMRSHSHSNVHKPSQDLLGLTLHEISDPIDAGTVFSNSSNTETGKEEHFNNNAENPKGADIDGSINEMDNATSCNTSKEVQDILGGLNNDFNSTSFPQQQPAIPPKQRPSSAQQREQISKGLKPLPRPPSRQTSILRHETNPRASPGPSLNSGASLADSTRRPFNTNSRKPSLASSIASEDSITLNNDATLTSNGQFPTSIGRKMSPSPLLPNKPTVTSRANDTSSTSTVARISSMNSAHAFGISRGPSPLTLGLADVVPLAVAFQEVCHACFRGSDETQVQVRLIGDLMVSFPAGIVNVIANNTNPTPLQFSLINANSLESLLPNSELITMPAKSIAQTEQSDSKTFEFNMKSLQELLKQQSEQNPSASYFNVDILKYQVRAKDGAGSCPLQMVAYWKCEDSHTDLRLDYKYNAHTMASPCPLLNLSVAVPIDGGVKNMQSQPNGTWLKESNRALWKFPELSQNNNGGVGSLRARFQLTNGPGSEGTIAAQFNCEGTTLSGVDFELGGRPGYRLSLAKKRFVSGKYICDGNAGSTDGTQYRYAAPPLHEQELGSGAEC